MDEDSSDEDNEDQLVCNMIGASWGSPPFQIIVDSVACASIMPTSWCNHVPLKNTPSPSQRQVSSSEQQMDRRSITTENESCQ